MSQSIPEPYQRFQNKYPAVHDAYVALGKAVHSQAPLSERERALVKLAMAVGAQQEGSVHAQVRKSLEAGLSAEEIRGTVLLALPSLGLPATTAAMTWANDILGE
jgi:4-carboxymuconolactone decarboxylase